MVSDEAVRKVRAIAETGVIRVSMGLEGVQWEDLVALRVLLRRLDLLEQAARQGDCYCHLGIGAPYQEHTPVCEALRKELTV